MEMEHINAHNSSLLVILSAGRCKAKESADGPMERSTLAHILKA